MNRNLAWGALVACCTALATVCATDHSIFAQSAQRLRPIDEAGRDPRLRSVRDAVLRAAKARDLALLQPLLASRVKVDFDQELAAADATALIAGYSVEEQRLFWQDLREGVQLGFVRQGEYMCAPYAVFQIPDRVDGSFNPVAIIASGVHVRREPSVASPVVDTLSYHIVAEGQDYPKSEGSGRFGGVYEWYQVRTPGGTLGWVLSKYLRLPGARRFCFSNENGKWKLSGWATGD